MKSKVIISSILTIVMCLSMIAGSTFALFTSESKVDVSVSSATVSVTATPTAPVMGSTLGAPLGTAIANGNSLALQNFVPGDYATFTINVVNNSTVAVKYRTVISVSDDNGLVSGLVVTIGADVYTGTTGNGELASTDWTLINPTEGNTSVDVKIALPEEAGDAYQGKTCTITYLVEAVQGNYVQATRVDSAEALVGALAAAQPGEIIDATGVTVAPTGNLDTTVSIPAGVTVVQDKDGIVTVKGPKGELSQKVDASIKVKIEDGHVTFEIDENSPVNIKQKQAFHGLYRALVNNMVVGVTKGFEKKLEIVGVGYRVEKQNGKIVLGLGYSHPVVFLEENGVTFACPDNTTILVKGIDKQAVGQMAAVIRSKRPPEPYLGKGIKYTGEKIRRKAGKTGK